MDLELARYITTHYAHLMSRDERLAYRHLATTYKVTGNRSDAAGQAEVRAAGGVRARWLSEQPHVQELAAGGLDAFLIRAGERILREHPHEVVLNRCPKCGGLTRTPTAKLCLHCGYSWHPRAAV